MNDASVKRIEIVRSFVLFFYGLIAMLELLE